MEEQYVVVGLELKCPTVDEVTEGEDRHLALACRRDLMMTGAMIVETEDITPVTVHGADDAGDKLKFL